ncbi:hypothetical protein [Cupriavidus nantongensis]|uniref:Uncharacterized protein n=1 Tax=Cupriavidus nantongensis TaxID=1796606 RepID=A0A142JGQ0_9BURK|nr:hypothetical protein [Cupriavidus nantongensis]AMR77262.1 hypothetical protein A2G96_05685 [Cupriavidus nantongensis]
MGFDPLTIGIGLAAAGSVLGAGAAIVQGRQQKAQAETQAELTRRDAAQQQDAALAQAEKIRRAGRQQQAETTANLAASGVSIGAGTPLRISNEIYRTSEQDAYQTILSGRRAQTAGDIQAGMLNASGNNAMTTGMLSAGGSLLSGAASAYKSGWRTKGAPVTDLSTYSGIRQ